MQNANIILMGKTGVGKSTLINSVFNKNVAVEGVGESVTRGIKKYTGITKINDYEFSLYDTEGIELKKNQQQQILDKIGALIQECWSEDCNQFIHTMWYCINAQGSRVEETEIEIINSITTKYNLNVIIVLTNSFDRKKTLEMQSYFEENEVSKKLIEDKKIMICPVLAREYPITEDQVIKAYGLDDLEKIAFYSVKNGAVNAYAKKLEIMVSEANNYSKNYIGTTVLTGLSPIPFSDAAILVPVQVAMLAKINKIFEVKMEEDTLKNLAEMVIKVGGTAFVGKTIVSNVLKFIPGVGTLAGGAISATVAGTLTNALAKSYIKGLQKRKRDEFYNLMNTEETFVKEVAHIVKTTV